MLLSLYVFDLKPLNRLLRGYGLSLRGLKALQENSLADWSLPSLGAQENKTDSIFNHLERVTFYAVRVPRGKACRCGPDICLRSCRGAERVKDRLDPQHSILLISWLNMLNSSARNGANLSSQDPLSLLGKRQNGWRLKRERTAELGEEKNAVKS